LEFVEFVTLYVQPHFERRLTINVQQYSNFVLSVKLFYVIYIYIGYLISGHII